MSAERTLDRLLPQAIALVFGTAAAAAGLAGIAADTFIGRPSATSAFGLILIFPLVLLAAVVGFALGHGAGVWLRRRGLNADVPMGPYRIVMVFVLGVATVIGATFGARPVLKHERLFRPRVMTGQDAVTTEPGWPLACTREAAQTVCNPSANRFSAAILSGFGEVAVTCSPDGRITLARPGGAIVASADLSAYPPLAAVHAAGVQQPGGGEAFAIVAGFVKNANRHLLMIFNPDGRMFYEQMVDGSTRGSAAPLVTCAEDDGGGSFVVDLDGRPVTYRPK